MTCHTSLRSLCGCLLSLYSSSTLRQSLQSQRTHLPSGKKRSKTQFTRKRNGYVHTTNAFCLIVHAHMLKCCQHVYVMYVRVVSVVSVGTFLSVCCTVCVSFLCIRIRNEEGAHSESLYTSLLTGKMPSRFKSSSDNTPPLLAQPPSSLSSSPSSSSPLTSDNVLAQWKRGSMCYRCCWVSFRFVSFGIAAVFLFSTSVFFVCIMTFLFYFFFSFFLFSLVLCFSFFPLSPQTNKKQRRETAVPRWQLCSSLSLDVLRRNTREKQRVLSLLPSLHTRTANAGGSWGKGCGGPTGASAGSYQSSHTDIGHRAIECY